MNPLSGGTYKPLPKAIAAKKAIINVKNPDNLCFLYSIIALKHPASDHVDRYTKYHKYITEFEYDEDEFPMKVDRIRFFEKKNNIGVSVYGCNDIYGGIVLRELKEPQVYPIRICTGDYKERYNLFLHDGHYSAIKDFNRFCGSQGSHEHVCP